MPRRKIRLIADLPKGKTTEEIRAEEIQAAQKREVQTHPYAGAMDQARAYRLAQAAFRDPRRFPRDFRNVSIGIDLAREPDATSISITDPVSGYLQHFVLSPEELEGLRKNGTLKIDRMFADGRRRVFECNMPSPVASGDTFTIPPFIIGFE